MNQDGLLRWMMYVSKLNFSGFCFSHEKVAYAMFVFE